MCPGYTKEEIQNTRSIDLYTYLERTSPSDLVRISGQEYCLQSDPYVHINADKGVWIRVGDDHGGHSALDYLIRVRGLSFMDAMKQISGDVPMNTPAAPEPTVRKSSDGFIPPEKNSDFKRVIAYLTKTRKISIQIIKELLHRGLLYEEKDRHNCVFIGTDHEGNAAYAMLRGTTSKRFVGDAAGSDKRHSFSIDRDSCERLVVCESPIDVLSYASLLLETGQDPWKRGYLSLSGVYSPGKESENSLPVSLDETLKHNTGIKEILLCLDGDAQGRETSNYLSETLSKKGFTVSSVILGNNDDINDVLVRYMSIKDYVKEIMNHDS